MEKHILVARSGGFLVVMTICLCVPSCAVMEAVVFGPYDKMCNFAPQGDYIAGCTQFLEKYPNADRVDKAGAYSRLAHAYEVKGQFKVAAEHYRKAHLIDSAIFASGGHSSYASSIVENRKGELRSVCRQGGGSRSDCEARANNDSQLNAQASGYQAIADAREAKSAEFQQNLGIVAGAAMSAAATTQVARESSKAAGVSAKVSPTVSTYSTNSSPYVALAYQTGNSYAQPAGTYPVPMQRQPASSTTASVQKPDKNHCVSQVSSISGNITLQNSCSEPVEAHFCYTHPGPDSWSSYTCHRAGQSSKFRAQSTIPPLGTTYFPYSKGARAVWFSREKNVYAVVAEFVGDRVRAHCR